MRIQWLSGEWIIDENVNFYAADDASHARIWGHDDCLAELRHDGSEWVVTWVESFFYGEHADHFIGERYQDVNDLITDLEALENAA